MIFCNNHKFISTYIFEIKINEKNSLTPKKSFPKADLDNQLYKALVNHMITERHAAYLGKRFSKIRFNICLDSKVHSDRVSVKIQSTFFLN